MKKLTPEEVKQQWKAAGNNKALEVGINTHIAVDAAIKAGLSKGVKLKDRIKKAITAVKTELNKK